VWWNNKFESRFDVSPRESFVVGICREIKFFVVAVALTMSAILVVLLISYYSGG
jgi:hypothetical protein